MKRLLNALPFSAIRGRLQGRSDLQGMAKNSGWLFFDKALRLGGNLLINIWIARYLGPEQFGLLSYVLAFVSLFGAVATLGLDSIVVRELVWHPERQPALLGSAFALKAIGGSLAGLLAFGTIMLRSDDQLTHLLVAIIAASTIFQAFDTVDFWFQSKVQAKYTVIALDSVFLLMAPIKLLLIWLQAPLVAFAWVVFAELGLNALSRIIVYTWRGNAIWRWRTQLSDAFQLLKVSWPLALSSLAVLIYMKIDQTMLGDMIGPEAVGIYSAATRLSEIWYVLPSVILPSIFPSIVALRNTDQNRYYQRLQWLFNLMVKGAIFIALPVSLFSASIVRTIFGEAFQEAGPILAIHIWAGLFVFLGLVQHAWDVAENYTLLSMQRTFAGAICNVCCNLLLIPLYGGMGAAIATLLSYACSAFLMNLVFPQTRPIFWLQCKAIGSIFSFKGLV